jgi:hypothetical protein
MEHGAWSRRRHQYFGLFAPAPPAPWSMVQPELFLRRRRRHHETDRPFFCAGEQGAGSGGGMARHGPIKCRTTKVSFIHQPKICINKNKNFKIFSIFQSVKK